MTQSNPFRVGLIGAGARWVPREHVPALAGVAEAEIYAVCRTRHLYLRRSSLWAACTRGAPRGRATGATKLSEYKFYRSTRLMRTRRVRAS